MPSRSLRRTIVNKLVEFGLEPDGPLAKLALEGYFDGGTLDAKRNDEKWEELRLNIKGLCWEERGGHVASVLVICPHPDAGKETAPGTRNPDRFYVAQENEGGGEDDGWVGSDYEDDEDTLAYWIKSEADSR